MCKSLAGAAALLLCACATAPLEPPAVRPMALPPVPAEDFQVRLHRLGCPHGCAVYELVLHADGAVDYLGQRHVAVMGARQRRADSDALAALRSRLHDSGLTTHSDSFLQDLPACGVWTTDQPLVVIELYQDGAWRRIDHDLGCADAPSGLADLEQAIDNVAHVAPWVGGTLY